MKTVILGTVIGRGRLKITLSREAKKKFKALGLTQDILIIFLGNSDLDDHAFLLFIGITETLSILTLFWY